MDFRNRLVVQTDETAYAGKSGMSGMNGDFRRQGGERGCRQKAADLCSQRIDSIAYPRQHQRIRSGAIRPVMPILIIGPVSLLTLTRNFKSNFADFC